jgi:thiamine pyrophosphokinase
MPRAVLFTNSRCKPEIKQLITSEDYIIAVDGGINTLEQINLKPHVIIGDFDSANSDNSFLALNIKTITHEPEKDFTDTELAINYAIEQGFTPIIIINKPTNKFRISIFCPFL